ncbi:hypothetical protein A1O3_02094 [Capronia epimyces CBS 606.96]|uniref:Uncharacterized protein n=1 Tax=Capronia epimyces CBS 606.96 TaxID=1182542 RepID=W9YH94_9EURO|nr:uncharacterized protein A1O3_02094 [Capronia epimyces CBS 606.96]EXJ89030.1 hypothetical protein A1O3_02094 [Capronia epimyces CBS 606.96]
MVDKPPSASGAAPKKAASSSSAAYISSSGHVLETPPLSARISRLSDSIYNFIGLYFVSLFRALTRIRRERGGVVPIDLRRVEELDLLGVELEVDLDLEVEVEVQAGDSAASMMFESRSAEAVGEHSQFTIHSTVHSEL